MDRISYLEAAEAAAAPFQEQMMMSLNAMCEARRALGTLPISDYVLQGAGGATPLSAFLGDRQRMFVIHNMGEGCAYCAAYADGLNGVLPHLEDAGAVLLVANMPFHALERYAQSRGWRFTLGSCVDVPLSRELGFEPEPGSLWPGTFVVERRDGQLVLSARYYFDPGDHFSPLWPMLKLAGLNITDEVWRPRLSYDRRPQAAE